MSMIPLELHIGLIFARLPLTISRFEYLWQDSENYKRPTKMSAPEYIEHLMSWVQSNIDNEQMFPSRIGKYRQLRHPRWEDSVNNIPQCRRSLPQNLLQPFAPNLQASVSCLRPYLLPSLPRRRTSGPRAPSEHQLQALRLVHR